MQNILILEVWFDIKMNLLCCIRPSSLDNMSQLDQCGILQMGQFNLVPIHIGFGDVGDLKIKCGIFDSTFQVDQSGHAVHNGNALLCNIFYMHLVL